jgi:hypothetical protein
MQQRKKKTSNAAVQEQTIIDSPATIFETMGYSIQVCTQTSFCIEKEIKEWLNR